MWRISYMYGAFHFKLLSLNCVRPLCISLESGSIDIILVFTGKSSDLEPFIIHPSYIGKGTLECIFLGKRAFQRKRLLVCGGMYC